jgi:hypothetical protein
VRCALCRRPASKLPQSRMSLLSPTTAADLPRGAEFNLIGVTEAIFHGTIQRPDCKEIEKTWYCPFG